MSTKNHPLHKHVVKVVDAVVFGGMKGATAYLDDNYTVRCTYQGKKPGSGRHTLLLSLGDPNYAERKFIKLAKKAGEPFPIKKVQLRLFRTKKRKVAA